MLAEDVSARERDWAGVRRIHILGGPGSGKSTLARALGRELNLPVYDLDTIAFESKDFEERPLTARLSDVHAIAVQPHWITEGIFLGWIEELLAEADAIIWLDDLPWHQAMWRIVVRFGRYGWLEARRRQGRERFLRFRDYGRNLRQLVQVAFMSRSYYNGLAEPIADNARRVSRAATFAQLTRYQGKVVRCSNHGDLSRLLNQARAGRAAAETVRRYSLSNLTESK